MTDYSQMSDFEINKAVAMAVGFPCYYGNGSYSNGHGMRHAVVKGVNCYGRHMIGGFEPVNSWIDAGPIIEKGLIALSPQKTSEGGCKWFAFSCHDINYKQVADNNPLRAAMICFLMMQGSSNANPI